MLRHLRLANLPLRGGAMKMKSVPASQSQAVKASLVHDFQSQGPYGVSLGGSPRLEAPNLQLRNLSPVFQRDQDLP